MGNMPAQQVAQQVMGPASVHGTLSLTARCNDVQCCSHGTFIIIVGNDDLEQKLTLNPTLCKRCMVISRAASFMSTAHCVLDP
jgi:hypothetical protein